MNYEAKLEKLAAGEIRGVRLSREGEWIAQTIAAGFLFLGTVVREALGNPGESTPEAPRRGPGRPRGSRVNFPEDSQQYPIDEQES